MPILSRRKVIQTSLLGAAIPTIILRSAFADDASINRNAWSVLQADPRFSDAAELFVFAGLVQYVQTDNFTAFVPTNAAFDKNPSVLPSLLRGRSRAFPDTTRVVEFIRSHALYDKHPLAEFIGQKVTLTAISGSPIEIDGTRSGIYTVRWTSIQSKIATAQIVDTPIVTENALIYPVDTVVLANN